MAGSPKSPGSPKSRQVKLQRCFFPDIPPMTIATNVLANVWATTETLVWRIFNSPVTAWYEAEDSKHVVYDSSMKIKNSVRALSKLSERDLPKMDDLDFVKKPTAVVSARILLLESYVWVAMCTLGYMSAMMVGAEDMLKWVIEPIFHPINSLFLAFIVPFYVHSRLRKAHWPEDEQRSAAFFGAVVFGLLGSYALGTPSTFAVLLPFVPLWIAHVSGYLEFMDMNRLQYLVCSLGLPYMAYMVFAFLYFEQFKMYALAWTALFLVIAADLQLKLGRLKRRWSGKELEHWDSTAVFIVAHFVISHLLTVYCKENTGAK